MTSISKLSSFEIVKRRNSLDNKPPHYAIATVIEAVVDASSSMSSMGDTPPEQIHKLIGFEIMEQYGERTNFLAGFDS